MLDTFGEDRRGLVAVSYQANDAPQRTLTHMRHSEDLDGVLDELH